MYELMHPLFLYPLICGFILGLGLFSKLEQK